jgi:hypothetical protein
VQRRTKNENEKEEYRSQHLLKYELFLHNLLTLIRYLIISNTITKTPSIYLVNLPTT